MTCRAMCLLDTHKRDLWLYPRPERKPSSPDSLDWHVRGMDGHDNLLLVMVPRPSDGMHDGGGFPPRIGKVLRSRDVSQPGLHYLMD